MSTDSKSDINDLIRATELSFQILQPFYENKSSSPTFERVKLVTDAYIRAIERSLHCSDRGIDICCDVLVLHEFFEEQKSQDYILPFLVEVQGKAAEACADARRMADDFGDVQKGLLDIYNSMPEPSRDFTSRKQWKRAIADLAGRFKNLSPKDLCAGVSSIIAPALPLVAAHPLLLIIIPLVASVVAFALWVASPYIEKKLLKKLHIEDERENVATNLLDLQKHVSKFEEWWSDMQETIDDIKQAYLQVGREEAMARLVKPSWVELQRRYTVYNDQIRKIRDSYPKCRTETPEKPAKHSSDSSKRVPLVPLTLNQGLVFPGLIHARWVGQQR